MDVKALDNALQEIIKNRMELLKLDYNNPKYDDLEEKLHDLEDAFQDSYGDELESALQEVHDEYCPDSDVLVPIAYIAKQYLVGKKNEYSVANNEGVFVEMDDYPGKDTRLVIVPNPVRIVLNIGSDVQKVVWSAK
ncbi:MAG TPA: hypothetical protein VG737_08900 [Cyclobacteriaceae bacterium]|nr:hypothetical protein [Cyclobacteriaceae bacterium]